MRHPCLLAISLALGWPTLAQAQEPVTLKFWDNQQTESGLSQYQQEAVKRFEAENPGVRAGAIMPLDQPATEAGIKAESFFPGAWASANYDGRLWGIPFNVDVWSFSFYNADLLQQAGVDPQSMVSWEGLRAGAEKLTDAANGKYGVGLFAHKGEDTVVVLDSFIFSNGGRVLNEDGSCALTSDESVAALEYLASLVPFAPQGIQNASSGDMRELFLNQSL